MPAGKYEPWAVLLVAVWLFTISHLDTLVVLVAFCTDEEYRPVEVLIGHYAGFSVGLAGAVVGAVVATGLFVNWTFLLGLVPLAMGIYALMGRSPECEIGDYDVLAEPTERIGVVAAAGIGLSGENVALFVPFFVRLSPSELVFVCFTYLLGAGVVYLLARWIARRGEAVGIPAWVDRWFVPVVLIVVGAYVFVTGWLLV